MRLLSRLAPGVLWVCVACVDPAPSTDAAPIDAAVAIETHPPGDVFVDATSTDVGKDTGADVGLGADAGDDTASVDPCGAVLSPAELAQAATLSPLPAAPPGDPTNKYADVSAAAVFGQRLFYESNYAGPLVVGDDGNNGAVGAAGESGKLSCASCHGGAGLEDNRSKPGTVSLGANFLARNSLGLINASHYRWTNWAGRFSAQWELPIAVAENAANMNSSRLRIAHVIFDKYRTDYEAVFGPLEPALGTDSVRFPASGKPKATVGPDGPWEAMSAGDQKIVNTILANFGKALQAYLRLLVSGASRFDRFIAGDHAQLDAGEQRGLAVFLGKGHCAGCHGGPHFSDDGFHNLGVPQRGERVPAIDNGRFADIPALLASPFNSAGAFSDDPNTGRLAGLSNPPPASTRAQFRTPTLRNVALTAPYMHAGQFSTLAEVVEFYDQGGGEPAAESIKSARLQPLGLTVDEKADLVRFLQSLNSAPLPAALLVNTAKP